MQKKFYAHKELHTGWMKDPKYRSEYQSLEPEFQIAKQIMAARIRQKLTQVGTGQAVISRLESMNSKPSLSLLSRVARALDTKLQITVQ